MGEMSTKYVQCTRFGFPVVLADEQRKLNKVETNMC